MPYKDNEKRRNNQRELSRRYREKHPEEVRERNRLALSKARQQDPKRFEKYREQFRKAHPGYFAKWEINRYYRQREMVFDAIGWICAWCGHDDVRVLEADHINDDAASDRKRFGRGGRSFWAYYSKHPDEAKRHLQPLCRNCNWLKHKGYKSHKR
jgi:hypothetical protein